MGWLDPPYTASAIEIAWTGMSLFGVLVSAAGLLMTSVNLRAAQRAHGLASSATPCDLLHVTLTWKDLRNERVYIGTVAGLGLLVLIFMTIGIVSMAAPEPRNRELETASFIAAIGLLLGLGLIVGLIVVLAAGSALNRRDRHRILSMITGRKLRQVQQDRRLARAERPSAPPPSRGD